MVSSPDGTVRQIRFRIGLYIMLCVAALDQTHYLTRSITVKKHCAARQSLNDRLNSIETNPEHFCSPLLRLQLHKINLSERQSIQFYLAWHLFHKPIARETSGGSKLKMRGRFKSFLTMPRKVTGCQGLIDRWQWMFGGRCGGGGNSDRLMR